MKIYDLKVSNKLSVSTAALFGVLIYLFIVIVLNIIQSFVDPTNEGYNLVYGVIQFLIATLYWIVYNYLIFSRPGQTSFSSAITYLVFTLLPISVFTLASSIMIYFYPTTDFTLSWNILSWIIAPAMFWYLPYSYIFYAFGYYINVPIFMGLMLAYVFLIEIIGIVLGLARRAHVTELEEAVKRQRERSRQMRKNPKLAFESIKNEEEPPTSAIITPTVEMENEKLFTGTNPFREVDEDKIIYTEAFQKVDSKILEKVNQENGTELINEEVDNLSKLAHTYNIESEDFIDFSEENHK